MADFLSQEEIDALLSGKGGSPGSGATEPAATPSLEDALTDLEKDTLGEIGNISMGSAATALSQILNKRVLITTPTIKIMTPAELFATFQIPYVLVEVNFTDGLQGSNLLIIKVSDAAIIADLMMGGSGQGVTPELDEIKSSAVAEAMNQMVGSAATSMATIFQRSVKITPPHLTAVNFQNETYNSPWAAEQAIAVVYFRMEIEGLVDSQIMQVIPVEVARDEVDMLMNGNAAAPAADEEAAATGAVTPAPAATGAVAGAAAPAGENGPGSQMSGAGSYATGQVPLAPAITGAAPASPAPPVSGPQMPPPAGQPVLSSSTQGSGRSGSAAGGGARQGQVYGAPSRNIDLILDVPLDIEVILGSALKRIQDILSLAPGSIVELDRLAEEPVQITVNGTPIAQGEVVIVNENFGVRITHILEPQERINHLRQ
ncbi:flagellar motor switch phosphatase FliY [Moorella sp. Hama-1]|uniref:flagellar motor switch phosphatase FliY n=1 Tax=Moorella sp. Hama-1 TaxID=2138101 RepID=UPI000D6473C9|nr:flagellar motor switch phosphatase FliY [Moorella sp. Hama-1]MDN5361949.1 flagellar motor switch protein FliN [Moorella sp. (in: firmicutes)]BCV20842.1 flagellar motor switch phosphatase FliY [Moorella sp. Hama-1]